MLNEANLATIVERPIRRRLDSIQWGLQTQMDTSYHLVHNSKSGNWLVPKVDLGAHNSWKRFVMTLPGSSPGFFHALNRDLKGGDSYPVLNATLGIVAGLICPPAGIAFSLAVAVIDEYKPVQAVLAREGDQVWQVERIGIVEGSVKHVNQFWIVDPYRLQSLTSSKNATDADRDVGAWGAAAWVIHEQRLDVRDQ